MCGICGIVNKDFSIVDQDLLYKITRILKHRGDNAHGTKVLGHVGLGHQRLSIIDLSERANQPFSSPDGRFWLVFNGEIYNFKSLRKELEPYYSFVSNSDTEVLLYSWIHWGVEGLERLDGMFAFAIWDTQEQLLHCVRDRMGVKPLFYHDGEVFLFASEIKSILCHPRVNKELDIRSLSDYLSLGYITGERTIFSHIKRFLPATITTLHRDGRISCDKYWDIRHYFALNPDNRKEDLIIEIQDKLMEAVARRLVSDVDIGFFLSGGVDSSAILTYAKRQYDKIQTFSIGFPEESYSELKYAEFITQEIGATQYSSLVLPPTAAFLTELTWFFDQPFADTSAVPTYQLSHFASKKVKVVLSGDGGDEMFGGYETYRADALLALGQLIVPFWKIWCTILGNILNIIPSDFKKVSTRYKLRQFFLYATSSWQEGHYSWRLIFDEGEKRCLLHPKITKDLQEYKTFDHFEGLYNSIKELPPFQQNIYVDFQTWLPDDILTKIDITSMAHSLEVRSPFLDRQLVELAVTIPNHWKVDIFHTKKILKKALSGTVPQSIIKRKKEGFNSPVSLWLINELRPLFMDTIKTEIFRSFFPDTNYIREIFSRHESQKQDAGFRLWSLLIFALWANNYL